ncbi:hypothetical protein MICRO11B_320008 [Micrococcus luteus]|nr:hypothetical protein MICRO11B_320008 [Micrococcus luteus]
MPTSGVCEPLFRAGQEMREKSILHPAGLLSFGAAEGL